MKIEISLINVMKFYSFKLCRYFPAESTQEMLDEWRPLLCPFDVTHIKAMNNFEYFLPTNLPPSQQDKGFKLVFTYLYLFYHSIFVSYLG